MTYGFFANKADKLQILESKTYLQSLTFPTATNSLWHFNFGYLDIKGSQYLEKLTMIQSDAMDTLFVTLQADGVSFNYISAVLKTKNLIIRILDISMKLEL